MIVYSSALMAPPRSRRRNDPLSGQNGPASATSTKAPSSRSRTSSTRPTRSASTRQRHALTFLDPRCWTDCPLLAQSAQGPSRGPADEHELDIVRWRPILPRAAQRSTPFHRYSRTHAREELLLRHRQARNRQKSLGVVRNRRVHDQVGLMSIHSDYMFIINAKLVKWLSPTIRFPVRRVRPPPCPNCASYSPTKASLRI